MRSAWSFEECGFALQDVNSGVAFGGHFEQRQQWNNILTVLPLYFLCNACFGLLGGILVSQKAVKSDFLDSKFDADFVQRLCNDFLMKIVLKK